MSKRKALLSIVLVLTLQSAVAGAASYCHETTGACWEVPPLGMTCNGIVNATPCPAAAATPIPTQTPTATPTKTPTPAPEVQPAYTIQLLFTASNLGWTYVQWPTMQDGVIWGDGGVCCPGLPDPSKPPGGDPNNKVGECPFAVDMNSASPKFYILWCTSADSSYLWESALVQVASSDVYKYVVTGIRTYRPATGALQNSWKDGEIWAFGVNQINPSGWQRAKAAGTVMHMSGYQLFPQAILDFNGARWLYARAIIQGAPQMPLMRFYWPDAWRIAYWDPSTVICPAVPSFNGIAIDADGSLIATDDDDYRGTGVRLWRSKDEGKTWVNTGIHFDARAGHTLFQCGFVHRSGGAALQPLGLVCTEGTGAGPEASDWAIVSVRTTGAKTYPGFGAIPARVP